MEYGSFKIYDLEAEKIFKGLRIADCMNLTDLNEESFKDEKIPYNLKELAISDVRTCSYCGVSFTDSSDQRNHYKLDWHRYNLKRALSGNQSVPEEVFDGLADDVSSISGSDSESSSEDSDTDFSGEAKKNDSENISHKFKTIRHTKAFFENEDNKILSVYKCLLHSKKESLVKEELVKSACGLLEKTKKWLIVMLGGGHFAAGVFDNGKVTHHKTFHCYTVRSKQGGSQFSRDNKGGSHPKSAGASLRRYNEQALVQHVQEIMASWAEPIKQCSLILYRATGPYNRGVLFGGKSPPLAKADQRLRNIPFPTRRATFKELKRVYDMLSSVEVYGSADNFKDKFPRSPDKRNWSPKPKKEVGKSPPDEQTKGEKPSPQRNRSKQRSPIREIPGEDIQSSSESEDDDNSDGFDVVCNDLTIPFESLKEYEDTVPEHIKEMKKLKKKRKKVTKKQKEKLQKRKWTREFERIQGNLIKSCEEGNKELLIDNINLYDTLPEKEESTEGEDTTKTTVFTKRDFIECLNAPTNIEDKNTLLHLAAINCLPEFITILLTAGADPCVKNKNKLSPYVIAGNKETRNSFRSFVTANPEKYDLLKAKIPEPATEEMEEKKREKRKLKRMKDKVKKQEDKEKKIEEIEKEKFLALSDREKCALAAERRLLSSLSSNIKSAKPPVLSRCFQCGTDITGKVPFEYGTNRFCSVPCVKAHRLKTKSYGVEI